MNFLPEKDQRQLEKISKNLPHALIIEAESGLDVDGALQKIIEFEKSEIIRLTPLDDKNIISVDQIRDLTAKIRTHSRRRRIVIISPADELNEQAQNALLKSLEEPSPGTHFLLILDSPMSLLDTIRSRCQSLKLHRTPASQDMNFLEGTNLTPAEKQQICFLASGRPLLIQKIANDKSLLADYQQLASDAKAILSAPGTYRSVSLVPRYATDRGKAIRLVRLVIQFIEFQAKNGKLDAKTHIIADKAVQSEQMLSSNCQVRLALLNVVV